MARMTRVSSEEDPRLVSPTKVGEDASESLFRPCCRKEPSSISRRCSDGRNNDRTWRFQCTIGSKVVIQFAAKTQKGWVAQYCVFRLAKGLTSNYEYLGDTNTHGLSTPTVSIQLEASVSRGLGLPMPYGHVTSPKAEQSTG